ncbi:hypothetical protein AVEN_122663-1 [Araneus ventricosus]|uniref:Uncharacterized protein n=1 Tax=Araneus ventricosus TaxID=182803 RepID=A0A4Y2FHI4_ARAVE|nr:hypothetical protein AVEN_122663-1 [Araneus ventricosus]
MQQLNVDQRKFNTESTLSDITDLCILSLDFLQNLTTVDLEERDSDRRSVFVFTSEVQSYTLYWLKKNYYTQQSECLLSREVPEASGKFRYAVTDFSRNFPERCALATLVDLKKKPSRSSSNLDHDEKPSHRQRLCDV